MKTLLSTLLFLYASFTYLNAQIQMQMNDEALKSYKKTDEN